MRTPRPVVAMSLFAVLTLPPSPLRAATWFVNASAVGTPHSGTSWTNAFTTVTSGLTAAAAGDSLWVAKAIYPEHLTLKAAVSLYGGFAGGETALTQRDISANATILDGGHAGTVVTVPEDAPPSTILDGFTIRNGTSSGGGGLFCFHAAPTITHNTFTGNTVLSSSKEGGGAILCDTDAGGTGALIAFNTFRDNPAPFGGAISARNTTSIIANNVIEGNTATDAAFGGGGIFCAGAPAPTVANNLIALNTAAAPGGGICLNANAAIVVNNTVSDDTAPAGGGIALIGSSSPQIGNNIFSFDGEGLYTPPASGATPLIISNDVYGNPGGNFVNLPDLLFQNNNLPFDPLFENRSAGDYHLDPLSFCINAGVDAAVSAGEVDLDGKPRLQGRKVDMGAYESPQFYGRYDAGVALATGGGVRESKPHDFDTPGLNPENSGLSQGRIDIRDAVRLLRKVEGLDAKPT